MHTKKESLELNKLPNVDLFKKYLESENYGSDNYGSRHEALRYCNLPELYIKIAGMWSHGCIPPWQMIKPEICLNNISKDITCFLGRKDEVTYAQSHGYIAKAIGLPYVYTESLSPTRVKDSLLVMPIHSNGQQSADNEFEDVYIDEILTLNNDFKHIVFCLSQKCIKNKLWWPKLEQLNIPFVIGAGMADKNGLKRVKYLMERFETMTTNQWGSHVAYALSSGMKVSIWGKPLDWTKKERLAYKTWQDNEDALDILMSNETELKKRAFHKNQYVHPTEAIKDKALGEWLIGTENKLSPQDLRKAFKWNNINIAKARLHDIKEYNFKYKFNELKNKLFLKS